MKKILVVYNRALPPINAGNDKCVWDYCQLLSKLGHEIFFLCEGEKKVMLDASNFFGDHIFFFKRSICYKAITRIRIYLRKIFKYSISYDTSPLSTRRVEKLHYYYRFDAIIVNYFFFSKCLEKCSIPQKVIFTHDSFIYRNERLDVSPGWYSLTPSQEAKALNRADCILSIQQNESILYKYLCPLKKIYTVYIPFKIHYPKLIGNSNILFLASNNELNYNGLMFFLNEVLPLILKEESQFKLIIGGKICEKISSISFPSNVEVYGIVSDLDSFYKLGDISINPVYQGTGLKVKTFEALSYGKVVVAHPHSLEGVYLPEKISVLAGETPEEYSFQILKVLKDASLRHKYSNEAISYIQSLNKYIELEYRKILE
jgi:hypothetical protein